MQFLQFIQYLFKCLFEPILSNESHFLVEMSHKKRLCSFNCTFVQKRENSESKVSLNLVDNDGHDVGIVLTI